MNKVFTLLTILLLFPAMAQAHRWHYEPPPPPPPVVTPNVTNMTITEGVSDSELADGLVAAMATGGHQFDFGTYRFQGSIVGTWEVGESSDAVSFGLGKRFEDLDVLWHGAYTRSGDHDFILFGGTFRF